MPHPKSPNRSYPQPHEDNTLIEDVQRIGQAIELIDRDSQKCFDKLRRVRLNNLLNENIFMI